MSTKPRNQKAIPTTSPASAAAQENDRKLPLIYRPARSDRKSRRADKRSEQHFKLAMLRHPLRVEFATPTTAPRVLTE